MAGKRQPPEVPKSQRGGPCVQPSPAAQPTGSDLLATALGDVKPLKGAARVAPQPPKLDHRPPPSSAPLDPGFVLERDEEQVRGYRRDLGPHALRSFRKGWHPQEQLDLHGRRSAGLARELAVELGRRCERGCRRLLLIHGKGLHSEGGGGVLAEAVVDALTEGRAAMRVRAFMTAPPRLGGSGALLVELDVRSTAQGLASRHRTR